MLTAPSLSQFSNDVAFQQRVADRLSPSRLRQSPKAREWQLDFGPVAGKKGTVVPIVVAPRCLFRGEKIMAMDNAVPPGSGTLIRQIFVGRKCQFPINGPGIPPAQFSNNSLGRGMNMTTCDAALSITIEVVFLEDCTFDATILGRAVI